MGDGAVMTPAMKDAEMKLKNGDEMRLMNAAVMTLTMLKGGVDSWTRIGGEKISTMISIAVIEREVEEAEQETSDLTKTPLRVM